MDERIKFGERGGKEANERRGSYGNIEEMLRRKREDSEERRKREREGEEIFRDSKKTLRSEKWKRVEENELGGLIRKWREETEEVMRDIKGVKGWM